MSCSSARASGFQKTTITRRLPGSSWRTWGDCRWSAMTYRLLRGRCVCSGLTDGAFIACGLRRGTPRRGVGGRRVCLVGGGGGGGVGGGCVWCVWGGGCVWCVCWGGWLWCVCWGGCLWCACWGGCLRCACCRRACRIDPSWRCVADSAGGDRPRGIPRRSMSEVFGIGWLVLLVVGNAFFVAAEFAVISARRSQIEPLAEAGKRSARTALWAMEHATLMLAMCQLGITVCSLLILNVSEPAIKHLLAGPLHLTGFSTDSVAVVSFIVALVLVSFLHVVIGEMVPKNISFSVPERAVRLLAPPLVFLARLFRPLTVVLNAIANAVLRLCGVEPKGEATSTFTLDEVQTIVTRSRREGVLDDASGTLSAAFEFTTKRVVDVQVPCGQVLSLPSDASPSDVERAVARNGFSRYPVCGDDGDLDGYVHLKDVIDLDDDEFNTPIPAKRIRRLVSIFEGTDLEDALALMRRHATHFLRVFLEDALALMRRHGTHLARVFAEDGRVTGVLFLEDIIEELVGEVQDATRR